MAILQIEKLYHMFFGDSKVKIRWRDICILTPRMTRAVHRVAVHAIVMWQCDALSVRFRPTADFGQGRYFGGEKHIALIGHLAGAVDSHKAAD